MREEIASLKQNQTWELMPKPRVLYLGNGFQDKASSK